MTAAPNESETWNEQDKMTISVEQKLTALLEIVEIT